MKFKNLKPCERLDVLYMRLIHKMTPIEIAEVMELNYKTVSNCIKAYTEQQRTFKLITKQTKQFLLKQRSMSKQAQIMYKRYRQNVAQTKAESTAELTLHLQE